MVQSELEDTKSKKDMLHQAHADTLKKSQLIEASMVAMAFEKVECRMLNTTNSSSS